MIICKECKKTIQHDNYYYVDVAHAYLCCDACRFSYAKKEKEKEDRKFLYDTVCRIFNVGTFPNGQQLAEIKKLKEKENMTYRQIASILHYIYDVKEFTPYGHSLALVTKYQDKAKEYYQENKQRAERAKEIANKQPVEMRRISNTNTSRNKKRGILEINPEDV